MGKTSALLFAVSIVGLSGGAANAHVSVVGGTGFANQTQEIKFGVGHGCAGVDTLSVRVEIPAGVTSVRAIGSTLGAPTVELNDAGVVTAVTWQKPTSALVEGDPNYYTVSIRAKLPDAPFSTLYFPTRQICSTPSGVKSPPVDWSAIGEPVDAGADEPAPSLLLLPARSPGWNKYVVPKPLANLKAAFGDAQIVWRGTAAFSANAATTELISATSGVTALTALAAGDIVWVRY